MEEKSNAFLGQERVGKLMAQYAVPCIISLPVSYTHLTLPTTPYV